MPEEVLYGLEVRASGQGEAGRAVTKVMQPDRGEAVSGSTTAAEVVLGVIAKRIRLLGLDRVADGSDAPGEHMREAHDGKMSAYLDAHADSDCESSGPAAS